MKKKIRLFNFLIDSTVFFMAAIIAALLFKNHIEKQHLKFIMIIGYYFYYFIFELTTGQTIGKMITKTKVVAFKQEEKVNFIKIFIRTLSRLIPIDIISYLFSGNGLHDFLSKTKLKKKST